MIRVEHHAPSGHAALGNPHSPIECHSYYHFGLNVNGTRLIGKIKLKCHIRDLRSEETCYVIDTDTLKICYWDDHEFIATPSSPLLSIKS